MKTAIAIFSTLILLGGCDSQNAEQRLVGQLESDRIEITAEVSEPIVERPVIEGQSVVAGTLLIRQDTSRIEARIAEAAAAERQAQARLDELIRGPRRELIEAARAEVLGARDELEFRETDLARAQEVFEKNLASHELRDRAKVARDTARATLENREARLEELLTGTTPEELRQAEQAVSQAAARRQSLEVDFDRHFSVAPVDSIVDSLLFEVGERPSLGQPMAILLSGNQPYARVFITEAQRVRVTPGTRARVFVDGLEQAFDGRVRWVASEAAFTPYFALTEHDRGRLSFAAKVDILDAQSRLPDGVPVEVELQIDTRTD
ncbi:MAG: HlyD family efflux transporter periplasmic adaptor subunit [Woeseiaceae bacterium]|nr:HlyD family efflux transporter periplasmic adaptor subunit [Woeseiaceae bacterium]